MRRVPRDMVSRYGIVEGSRVEDAGCDLYSLRRLVEKPVPEDAPTDLAIAGRYLFNPEIFDCIDRVEAGADGEVQLTDAMNVLAGSSSVQALLWRAQRYDIGNKADYVRCFLDFARRHPETKDAVAAYLQDLDR